MHPIIVPTVGFGGKVSFCRGKTRIVNRAGKIADGAKAPHDVDQIMNTVKFGEVFIKKSKNYTI